MRTPRFVVSVLVCLLLISVHRVFAQDTSNCIEFVRQALVEFGNNCANLQQGTACYGHKDVQTEMTPNTSKVFSKPADRIQVSNIKRIQTTLAATTGSWGLALLDLSTSTTGAAQSHIILMGEAQVTLPTIASPQFQILSGYQQPICEDATSLTALQTTAPEPLHVKINGIDANISSSVIFQRESANSIKAIVPEGTFAVSGVTASAGQTVIGVADNYGTILFWSAPRLSNDSEQRVIDILARTYEVLNLPLFTTPITIATATPAPLPPIEPTSQQNESCGRSVTHVVEVGENLFRIALRYGTSIDVIARANGISDPNQIVVGQTLIIPCGNDSGTSSVSPGNGSPNASDATPAGDNADTAPTNPTVQTVDCSAFSGNLPPNLPPAFQQMLQQICQP